MSIEQDIAAMRSELTMLRLRVEELDGDERFRTDDTQRGEPEERDVPSQSRIETIVRDVAATAPDGPGSGGAYVGKVYSFEGFSNENHTGITVEPGDIRDGAGDVWCHWSDITGYNTVPATVSASLPCLFLVFDTTQTSPSAMATLYADTREHMEAKFSVQSDLDKYLVFPLIETSWADDNVTLTEIKNLQCGDINIDRTA